jgi:hypothetical protein
MHNLAVLRTSVGTEHKDCTHLQTSMYHVLPQVAGQSAYALLDSGTTDTYLLRSSGPVFQALFEKATGTQPLIDTKSN